MSDPNELEVLRTRAAHNQSVFRQVNESIENLSVTVSQPTPYVCECLNLACTEAIAISRDEYEQERQDPNRFFVLAGHEQLDVEEVVKQTSRYSIVSKLGIGGDVAAALDPRAYAQPADPQVT